MMFISKDGVFYVGDMLEGDREATAAEILAREQSRANQVPKSVTRFQAKAALLGAGLLAQVDAYMALPDTPMVTKLAWTETQDFERASPTVAGLASLLGLTSEQVDALFITASGITA